MVETAGGMITKPGTRVIQDFANWKNEVEWPDLSVVDFKTDGEKIQKMLDPPGAGNPGKSQGKPISAAGTFRVLHESRSAYRRAGAFCERSFK